MYPNLKAEMARNGFTISTLARELGIRPATLSDKLDGKTGFTLEQGFRIKLILGVDMPLEILFEKAAA